MNLNLFNIFNKLAQVGLDELGKPPSPDPSQENAVPSATRPNVSQEETKIETGDPLQTQMNGAQNPIQFPAATTPNIDSRVQAFIELIEKTKGISDNKKIV